MSHARYDVVIMIWLNPCDRSSSIRNSRIGLLMIGIIGLGIVSVMGRTRVPLPPARITAFMTSALHRLIHRGKTLHGLFHRAVSRKHAMQADDFQHRFHRRLHVREPDIAMAAGLLQMFERRHE